MCAFVRCVYCTCAAGDSEVSSDLHGVNEHRSASGTDSL